MWCRSNTFSWTNEKRTNFNGEHFSTLIRVRTERNLFENKPVIKALVFYYLCNLRNLEEKYTFRISLSRQFEFQIIGSPYTTLKVNIYPYVVNGYLWK